MEKHFAIPKSIFRRFTQKPRKNPGKNYARCTTIHSLFIVCSQKFNNFSSIFYHLYHCTKVYKMCNFSYIAQKHFRIVENFCTKKQKENFSYVFCAFWRKILHKSRACFLCILHKTHRSSMWRKKLFILWYYCTLWRVATATFWHSSSRSANDSLAVYRSRLLVSHD